MAKLNVEIVTPERRVAKLEADEVIAPGAEGLFGVRPGHTPYLSLLQPGALTVKDGATTTVYFVAGGFAEAGPKHVRVLADGADVSTEIDVAAAKKRLQAAEEKLKSFESGDARGDEFKAIVIRERRRLEVAGKRD